MTTQARDLFALLQCANTPRHMLAWKRVTLDNKHHMFFCLHGVFLFFVVGHFAEKIRSKNVDLELENKDNKFLQPTCWSAVPKDVYYI